MPTEQTGARAVLWRPNEFGDPEQALYLGGLYVGGIVFLRHIEMWQAWFMNDPEGNGVDCCATPEDARRAVENALIEALPEPFDRFVEEERVRAGR